MTRRVIIPIDMGGSPSRCAVGPPPTEPPSEETVRAMVVGLRIRVRATRSGLVRAGSLTLTLTLTRTLTLNPSNPNPEPTLPYAGMLAYSASKAAVVGLTKVP